MIERDYIMRMIRQLTAAIAKVLFRIEQNQLPEAFRDIDDACRSLIGAPLDFLRSLSDRELISLFGTFEQADKLLAAAELLKQTSRLHARSGEADESFRQGAKAFSLYVELLVRQKNQAKLLDEPEWEALLEDLERYELPDSIELKRSRFYEMKGDFGKAMAILSALIEHDPELWAEGTAMGRRMVELSDQELARAGFSRESVIQWRLGWENPPAS